MTGCFIACLCNGVYDVGIHLMSTIMQKVQQKETSVKKACVIGSFNIDIVTSVKNFPQTGETVRCSTFDLFIGGGKGANQAVALGKLGADVLMVGRLGDGFYGPEYMEVLQRNQVRCDAVDIVQGAYPGSAFVSVNSEGDNILFIYPGTNAMVDVAYIDKNWHNISQCDIFLFQLEIPLETNLYAMRKLKELGKTIILDPAPAMELPIDIYSLTDYITPNEIELQQLSGVRTDHEEDLKQAAKILMSRGAHHVIAKVGRRGAYIIGEGKFTHVPPIPLKAIDPTAAGDSFNAGFAYSLMQGKDIDACVQFANVVAGISTQALGAQSAMPTLRQVNDYLLSL